MRYVAYDEIETPRQVVSLGVRLASLWHTASRSGGVE